MNSWQSQNQTNAKFIGFKYPALSAETVSLLRKKKNNWVHFKWLISPSLPGNTSGLFSTSLHSELMSLLEIKLRKVQPTLRMASKTFFSNQCTFGPQQLVSDVCFPTDFLPVAGSSTGFCSLQAMVLCVFLFSFQGSCFSFDPSSLMDLRKIVYFQFVQHFFLLWG